MKLDKNFKLGAELSEDDLDGVTGGVFSPNATPRPGATPQPTPTPTPSPQPSIPSIPPDPGRPGGRSL